MQNLEHIIIYPIKSLGGINVEEAIALDEGFQNDRRLMLVDSSGKFQTQRETAILSLFKTQLNKNGIIVSYKDDEILIPLDVQSDIVRSVNVFEHQLKTQEISSNINTWFSDHLNKEVQLVKMTKISNRIKELVKPPFKSNVSLADGYPYLILGTASIDNLNGRMNGGISHDRFRPNIYINTDVPHCEDEWQDIQIGTAKFRIIKPCARCQVTTINQQTSLKGPEPLKTLATYRKFGNRINFGANMILIKSGKVSMGDSVKFL